MTVAPTITPTPSPTLTPFPIFPPDETSDFLLGTPEFNPAKPRLGGNAQVSIPIIRQSDNVVEASGRAELTDSRGVVLRAPLTKEADRFSGSFAIEPCTPFLPQRCDYTLSLFTEIVRLKGEHFGVQYAPIAVPVAWSLSAWVQAALILGLFLDTIVLVFIAFRFRLRSVFFGRFVPALKNLLQRWPWLRNVLDERLTGWELGFALQNCSPVNDDATLRDDLREIRQQLDLSLIHISEPTRPY